MLFELFTKNRSVREFDASCSVSRETLEKLVSCTRLCASSANLQPLKYRLVYEVQEGRAVFEQVKWAGYLPKGTVPAAGNECGAFVVICLDTALSQNEKQFMIDTGIAAEAMSLAATELGLGCCMMSSFAEEPLRQCLQLPARYKIMLVLAVGKPRETVEIVDAKDGIKYYREGGVHYVPKRSLDELIIQ